MENTLKIGDVVKLKSSNKFPAMTVVKVDGEMVTCAWFDIKKSWKEKETHYSSVEICQPDNGPIPF